MCCWPCTARCGIPVSFQFLGWCPFVIEHGLLRVLYSVVTTWHLKPQRKPLREGRRAPEAPHESPQRLKTRFPLLRVHLCVGLPH